eukprot:scaffold220744_cov36-Tisochrysis_lutea.AAC.2
MACITYLPREIVVLRLPKRAAKALHYLLDLVLISLMVLIQSLEAPKHEQGLNLLFRRRRSLARQSLRLHCAMRQYERIGLVRPRWDALAGSASLAVCMCGLALAIGAHSGAQE